MSRLRIGIIGCGSVTQTIHLPALNQLNDLFVVTALCDVSPNVLAGLGDDWGIATRVTDYQELLALDSVDAVRQAVGGFLIFRGKITDVDRRIEGGWNRGDAKMSGSGDFAGQELLLEFQNEHLAVRVDGEFAATVPDLIAVLDSETGEPITTEALRYGMRVAVIAFPCAPQWREPAALELAHPRYFGYDVDYVPVEERFGETNRIGR